MSFKAFADWPPHTKYSAKSLILAEDKLLANLIDNMTATCILQLEIPWARHQQSEQHIILLLFTSPLDEITQDAYHRLQLD